MAHVAGYGGDLAFTNLTAGVRGWELTDSIDMLDTTDFADTGFRTFIGGLSTFSFTADVIWDEGNTAAPGDSASFTLTVTTGSTYTGTALYESASTPVVVDGLVTQRATFRGTGELTRPS